MKSKKKRLFNPYALFYVLDTREPHSNHNAVNDYINQWNDIVQNSTIGDALDDAHSSIPSGSDVADSSNIVSSDFGAISFDGDFGGCDGGDCSASAHYKRLTKAKASVSADEARALTEMHENIQKIKYALHTIQDESAHKISDGKGNHSVNPNFVQHNYKVKNFAITYEKEMDKMLNDIKQLLLDFQWASKNEW